MKKIVMAILVSMVSITHAQIFTETTSSAGIDVTKPGAPDGHSWVDFNKDGFYDLFLGTRNYLYKNNGNGTFTIVQNSGIPTLGTSSSTFADFDNDGYPDLLILPGWFHSTFPGKAALLYKNLNGDSFTLFLEFPKNPGDLINASAWADYNKDGFLDFYLANYDSTQFGGKPDRLYKNNGDGTFTNVAGTAIPIDYSCGRGVIWGDYDNDGDSDIYVSNYRLQPNFLYRNNNDGTFTNVASSAGVAGAYHSYGSAWGDYDNDGDLDLIMPNIHDYPRLYRNNGNGTFTEVTSSAGLYIYSEWSAAAWFDYDNDTDLDLLLMRWYAGYPVLLMRNNGNGTFTDVTSSSGITGVDDCSSGIVGDYDNDGFLDLLLVDCENWSYKAHLYKNNGNQNHWIQIETEGTISNKDGIGARINLFTGSTQQIREVECGGEGGSQHMKRVHFGLASYTLIDSIIVKWPSGIVDKLYNIPSDTIIYLVEGTTLIKETKLIFNKLIKRIKTSNEEIKLEFIKEIQDIFEIKLIDQIGRTYGISIMKNGKFLKITPKNSKEFNSGIYILKLKSGKENFKEKIIIF